MLEMRIAIPRPAERLIVLRFCRSQPQSISSLSIFSRKSSSGDSILLGGNVVEDFPDGDDIKRFATASRYMVRRAAGFASAESGVGFFMLTSQKVIDAINEQIGYEFSAELQYYAIGAHFATEALPQLSQHFFQQAEEEKGHALRFIKYVVDAGGRVVIPAINAPKSKFKTARDAVKLSLDQEIHVTQQINGLVGLARKQNDYITINFLQWFLTEQLEEVSSMDSLLKIIERAGTDLLQADEYLARVGVRAMPEPPKE